MGSEKLMRTWSAVMHNNRHTGHANQIRITSENQNFRHRPFPPQNSEFPGKRTPHCFSVFTPQILRSDVGSTSNLADRLHRHNRGDILHTSKYRPWQIKTAIAFSNKNQATQFEKYLKSPSGRAFAKKRL